MWVYATAPLVSAIAVRISLVHPSLTTSRQHSPSLSFILLLVGAACQIKDCVRDPTTGIAVLRTAPLKELICTYVFHQLGEACSGHGSCVNMNRFFLSYGLSYGNVTDGYLDQGWRVEQLVILLMEVSALFRRNYRSTFSE